MPDVVSVTPAATPRRAFLGQLATAAAALTASACVGGTVSPGPAAAPAPSAEVPPKLPPMPPLPELEFDDAWAEGLTGRYRAVFDSPEIEDGTAIFNAYTFMQGFESMYKVRDADVNAVIVVRHMAIPMVFDDTIWDRYDLGKLAKVKKPGTEQWARRNPFWKAPADDTGNADFTFDALQKRGTVVLACALATHGMANILAGQSHDKPGAVFDELRRHLIPGAVLQPSGIYAVMRAQEAGCHYMRST